MRNQLARLGLLAAVVIFTMGAKGGCGGGEVSPAKGLCTGTGGTWDDSDCPSAVWPPACGATAVPSATCGETAVCKCPASAPYWVDGQGCWSKAQCDQSCKGTASSCNDSCSQAGCYKEQCLRAKTCTRQKYNYRTCYRTDSCYQYKRCYQYKTCYDFNSDTTYDCGSYDDCGYYDTCTKSYDCGNWYTETYDCSYYESCGPCKGSPTACTAIKTPQSCQSQAGCRWE